MSDPTKPGAGKRASRRQAKARMKGRARDIYPHDPSGALADHLASCSCPMCGNPRRHFGAMSLQEQRAIEALVVTND